MRPGRWGRLLPRLLEHRGALGGSVLLLGILAAALLAPAVAPYDPARVPVDLAAASLRPPGKEHWLGTDLLGRDLFSRILYGARVSLLVGFAVALLTAAVGAAVGLLAGFYAGTIDAVFMRVTDAVMAFPALVLAIAAVAVLDRPGLLGIILVLTAVQWTTVARLVRGQALSLREREFVAAAYALGARDLRILARHLLPNCAAPLLVSSTFGVASNILAEAGLSFLGLGIQPPAVSWGSLLAEGAVYLTVKPWLVVFPGLAITLTVLGCNLAGDGLRDILEPRLTR
ncbi:MAG: ABC transporter permease [candidate division NC10 bacterium]|nr:ABC transporter permease [candidate division NC10 bacterium]